MEIEATSPQIVERAGCPIHYWLSGLQDRPLVVLTHGATADHRMFNPQVSVLTEQYRVLTWDVRGHGLSRPMGEGFSPGLVIDDLLALLDQTGYARAVVAGQSMGGNIAQEMVFRYPERVSALIAIDCTCNTLPLTGMERWLLDISPTILRLYPYETYKRQAVQASALRPDVRKYLYEACSQITREDMLTIMVGTAQFLHYEPGYTITQPQLLLLGDHDNLGNIKKAMPAWAARDPDCRLALVPDAGHGANLDNPELVNRLLLDFLREHAR